jgi:tetraacyldisaccharide 4'-kinase
VKAPAFWREDGWRARALAPAGAAYALAGALRWRSAGEPEAPLPVICVGNATVGGTGKTPITLDLLARLGARGRTVHALCRGHGGRLSGPVRVDPAVHGADDVGDEALLLAEMAPTWAGRDRRAAARAAAEAGATLAVLDDGLQYPHLAKHTSLLVVDAADGFGNGRVVPAGPLREPLKRAQARAHAAVLVGDGEPPAGLDGLPVFRARLEPTPHARALAGRRMLAFAGIGRPEKFFATARALGVDVVATRAFADHHRFSVAELDDLVAAADRLGCGLLTTTKDRVRLPAGRRARVATLAVRLAWAEETMLDAWLDERLAST